MNGIIGYARLAVAVLAASLGLNAVAAPTQNADAGQPSSPVVSTDKGKVQGAMRNGVLEFRGIPFGGSVSGDKRWTVAQPAQAWDGILPAISFKPPCAQAARYNLTEASDNEDCLYLNVSRPHMEGVPLVQQKRPVLVWIHGGSFVGGSGSLYRLDRLAKGTDAVIVSINYRLGVLGFMPHPGFEAQYNGGYALEDQRLAMRWVKDNIAAFGGDPGNITLAGESAGGASVCMHLTTPERTQGLFHKAIIQSAACSFSLREAKTWGEEFGNKVAQEAGCTDTTTAVACMRGKDVQTLIAAGDKAAGSDLMAMAPVYGTHTLPRQGLDSLQAGRFLKIPVMYGGTRDELRLWVGYAVQAGQRLTAENYLDNLRTVYGDNAAAVQARYPVDSFGSAAATLGSVTSDFRPDNGINHCQFLDTAQLLSRQVAVYQMDFADRQAPVLGVSMPATPDPGFELGAVHSAELNYFFPHFSNTSRMDAPDLQPASQALADQLIAAWASFMRTGTPQATGIPTWETFDKRSAAMRFEPGRTALFDPGREYQCEFWKKLYPQSFAATTPAK